MDKKLASTIVTTLNTPIIMDAIIAYTDAEIEILRQRMERTHDYGDLRSLQGAIEALRKLQNIRRDAIAVMDRERNG